MENQLINEKIKDHWEYVKLSASVMKSNPKYEHFEFDELLSMAYFGAVAACKGFKEDSGMKFHNYLKLRAKGSILDYIRKQQWGTRYNPIEMVISHEEVLDVLKNEETLKNQFDKIVDKENEILLEKEVDKLSPKEQLVINMYFYEESSLKEIGNVLNYGESMVSQIKGEALKKLKNRLKGKL